MDRLACVDVPALPLQLLLCARPDFRGHAVVVVEEDKPQGVVLFANEKARAHRILPGMRYQAALSLSADLRAGVVEKAEVEAGVSRLFTRLLAFSPDVEPKGDEPGVFWLNASGLSSLYPSLEEWARRIRAALFAEGFFSTVVVGFHRFYTYTIARSRPGYGVLPSPEKERALALKVPLERIGLSPDVLSALFRLGVRTVDDFVRLPVGGLEKRFGKKVQRLARLAKGDLDEPLAPQRPKEPVTDRIVLDFPERDSVRLLFFVKGRLFSLLRALSERGQALSALVLVLVLEKRQGDAGAQEETVEVRPAAPTLDERQLSDLLCLRLEALERAGLFGGDDKGDAGRGIVEVRLRAEGVRASLEQVSLFSEGALEGTKVRDLKAADRALARLRARFGDDAVVRACLTEGHLPEAQFRWERMGRVPLPKVSEGEEGRTRPLVRRLFSRPIPLPPRPRHEPDGWFLRGLEEGPVVRVLGPYIVSGGWWRALIHREYHFAETKGGEILWVYYDRRRRRWFLQGAVE